MSDIDAARQAIGRLIAQAEALGAVGAHLSSLTGEHTIPPELARRAAAVSAAVVGPLDGIDPGEARRLAALVRAMLGQAAGFATSPDEPERWTVTDPTVLQSLGQASAAFAALIRDELNLEGLAAALATPGAAILDAGVGVGALAAAFANCFPAARVVGLDVWPPALDLAQRLVETAALGERIELRLQDVADLDDIEHYDLVWFAGPFIPAAVQPAALARCAAALRPGGWLVYGAFSGADPLSSALADLRTARSGGPVLDDDELAALLRGAGLRDVTAHQVDIGIASRVAVGRRP